MIDLKQLRWRARLTQAEVAARMGKSLGRRVTQQTVSDLERGVRKHGSRFDLVSAFVRACGYRIRAVRPERRKGKADTDSRPQ